MARNVRHTGEAALSCRSSPGRKASASKTRAVRAVDAGAVQRSQSVSGAQFLRHKGAALCSSNWAALTRPWPALAENQHGASFAGVYTCVPVAVSLLAPGVGVRLADMSNALLFFFTFLCS